MFGPRKSTRTPHSSWRIAAAAALTVVIAVSVAGYAFHVAAAPHRAGYATATTASQATCASCTSTPAAAPAPLPTRAAPDPVLAAIAAAISQAGTRPGDGPPTTYGRGLFTTTQTWTGDGRTYTVDNTIRWRDRDGSGFEHSLTQDGIPSGKFSVSPHGLFRFDPVIATHRQQSFPAGAMPPAAGLPVTLSADPAVLRDQLALIRPGTNTPAGLLRAMVDAEQLYFWPRDVRAAVFTILAETAEITTAPIAFDPAPNNGLAITGRDTHRTITTYVDRSTGYWHGATIRPTRRNVLPVVHMLFLRKEAAIPKGWFPARPSSPPAAGPMSDPASIMDTMARRIPPAPRAHIYGS